MENEHDPNAPSEVKINEQLDELMKYDVKGALLIHADGLCIASRGEFNPEAAGLCAQVVTSAFRINNLTAEAGDVFFPPITIETDQSVINLNTSNGCYLAVSYPSG